MENMISASALLAAVFVAGAATAGPARLGHECDAVFPDRGLLPTGVDDFHCATWTWPGALGETRDGRPPAFEKPENWPGFCLDPSAGITTSFHWIWAARRMYEAVDAASDAGCKAFAEWKAAKEPPLLYYHIDRRSGDDSWTPIDFALSRDGKWMLCEDDPAVWPGSGATNGWRLLAIPEWRETRVKRLFFELPDKEAELDAIRHWPKSASYSPFPDGLDEAELVAATGCDTPAPREKLAPPELCGEFGDLAEPSAANAVPGREVLDSALARLGPPSVRRMFEFDRGQWAFSWAWTKDDAALVVRFVRDEGNEGKPPCATVHYGLLAEIGEIGEEAVGRGWSHESAELAKIIYRFDAAPIPDRRNVEVTLEKDPLGATATYRVTDGKGVVLFEFRVPVDFGDVSRALVANRFRWFPRRPSQRVGGWSETLSFLTSRGDVLFSGTPETDGVTWEGRDPFMKKVADVFEHVLPFAIYEVRTPSFAKSIRDERGLLPQGRNGTPWGAGTEGEFEDF